MQPIQTIWVYGIGGVGGYWGGKIAHYLHQKDDPRQVFFIARGKHLQAIQDHGLVLVTGGRELTCIPAAASQDPNDFPSPDLCLLCVKSYDLEGAVRVLREFIREDTLVIPVLNGVDIYDRVRRLLSRGLVLPGCVYISGYIEKPGRVVEKGTTPKLMLGADPAFPDFDPGRLMALSQEMNLNFVWNENPFQAIWEKYLLVAPLALVTAATGESFGEVLEDEKSRSDVIGIMHELILLGQTKGISMDESLIDRILNHVLSSSYHARSSFQRDLEQGKGQAETDVFERTLLQIGEEKGVPIPITQKVCAQVRRRYPLA